MPHRLAAFALQVAALCAGLLGSPASPASHAEDDRAAPRRYLNTVFAEHVRHGNLVYAENVNNLDGKVEKLTMRVFEPKGDTAARRPLLVLTPGGGFVRTEDFWMDDFGEELARAGYVVAIHRYRLSKDLNSPARFYDALFKAMSDQKAVIRWFVQDAAGPNRFKVDVDNIFIGGHSAGAFTSLYTAYLDARNKLPDAGSAALKANGGLDGNSGYEQVKFTLRGVINLSGAVTDIDMFDAGEPVLLSIHGDKDDVVPLGSSPTGLHGSATLHQRAQSRGIKSVLQVVEGGDHIDPADPKRCPECLPLIKRFMFNTMQHPQ
ncbi:alpha/beta hydrolase [Roseateles cellulosilyticus]|uniref:Alpha/beta hydrolase n=1 Tax=Pelomonas cellulosilytica TaxID=2906762 RepID=A0ABS8XRA0_9BURK|nr:alpha/beta hydrolase [Pelomonas sp. P8]MCE4553810.1 alpha/beta hydrolase [Pelomonas sp. P8]